MVTTHGDVKIRDVKNGGIIASCSMKIFQTNNSKIYKMWLSENGNFHVSTDNGAMYCWNEKVQQWNIIHKARSFLYTATSDENNLEIMKNIKSQPPSNVYPSAKNGIFTKIAVFFGTLGKWPKFLFGHAFYKYIKLGDVKSRDLSLVKF